MQFDLLRAFPYPVLRHAVDDYVDGDIQATVDFKQSSDGLNLTASVTFALSVPAIMQAIDMGVAAYSVVFACRDTYFRKAVLSQTPTFSHSFPAGSIRGEVLIYPYVVATSDIVDFSCEWIVFELVKDYAVPENEWRVDANQDKVVIKVSPETKAKIALARNDSAKKAILLNSIYMGAVIQCVALLKHDHDIEDFRWAHIFRARCDELSIDVKTQAESWVAQQLMKHPLKLIDAYFFDRADA